MIAHRGSALSRLAALALAAAVIAIVGIAVVRPALTRYADTDRRIETLRGEVAKLRAAAGRAEARRAEMARLDEDPDLRGLALPPASEASATAWLQERFGGIIENSGARLSTTQVLPVKQAANARQLGLRLQFTANTTSLRVILHALEFQRPVAIVESLFIYGRSAKAVGNPLPLNVRLDVYSFLAAEG